MAQRWTFIMRLGKLGTSFLSARKRKSNIGFPLWATSAGAHASLGGVPGRRPWEVSRRGTIGFLGSEGKLLTYHRPNDSAVNSTQWPGGENFINQDGKTQVIWSQLWFKEGWLSVKWFPLLSKPHPKRDPLAKMKFLQKHRTSRGSRAIFTMAFTIYLIPEFTALLSTTI